MELKQLAMGLGVLAVSQSQPASAAPPLTKAPGLHHPRMARDGSLREHRMLRFKLR